MRAARGRLVRLAGLVPLLVLVLVLASRAGVAEASGPVPGVPVVTLPGFASSLTAAGPGRVLVGMRDGRVLRVQDGVLAPGVVLTRPVREGDHAGLLGLAWAADAGPGRPESLWAGLVCPVAPVGDDVACAGAADMVVVVRYRLDDSLAVDPVRVFASGIPLTGGTTSNLGGALALSPDGSLFVSVGDHCDPSSENCRRIRESGSPSPACAVDASLSIPNNPLCNTPPQVDTDVRGKILRIDPWPGTPCGAGFCGTAVVGNPWAGDPDPVRRLVWGLGFRNVFGLLVHPDSAPGSPVLFATDNGSSLWDEVNVVSPGGRNYGWPYMEGNEEAPPDLGNPAPPPGVVAPAWQADSAGITGIAVSPGPQPNAGRLLVCQFVTGTAWELESQGPAFATVVERAEHAGSDCRAGITRVGDGLVWLAGAGSPSALVTLVQDSRALPVVLSRLAGGW